MYKFIFSVSLKFMNYFIHLEMNCFYKAVLCFRVFLCSFAFRNKSTNKCAQICKRIEKNNKKNVSKKLNIEIIIIKTIDEIKAQIKKKEKKKKTDLKTFFPTPPSNCYVSKNGTVCVHYIRPDS